MTTEPTPLSSENALYLCPEFQAIAPLVQTLNICIEVGEAWTPAPSERKYAIYLAFQKEIYEQKRRIASAIWKLLDTPQMRAVLNPDKPRITEFEEHFPGWAQYARF